MTDEQNKNKETPTKLALSKENKSFVYALANPTIPEQLSGYEDPKEDIISRTQSTDSRSKVSDSDD